jgi:hypothetical protein
MNKENGLSRYKQKKIMRAFCADIMATQVALIPDKNGNTINRYDNIFRRASHAWQGEQKARIIATVEVDESCFGRTRPRGVYQKRTRFSAEYRFY